MKVAVVSPYALDRPGGVQHQVIEIGNRLAAAGIEAWIVGPGRSGPPGARLVGDGITIPANGSRAPIALTPATLRRTRAAVAGADVVHLHEPLMPLTGWSLLAGGDVPVAGTFHADPPGWVRSTYRTVAPLLRRATRRLAAVSAVSEVAAAAVRPFRSDVEIIPNALDVAAYRTGGPRVAHRAVFIGRDEARKGLDVLLTAWQAVRAAVPEAELRIIGAERSVQVDGVRFLGRVGEDEKRRQLASAGVFVAPNLGGESFGITVLEGMAAGCAVVASDLPAFIAVGGGAPRFFPRGDDRALAEAIMTVMLEEDIHRSVGEQCARRSEAFDWTTVLPAYIRLYEAALRGV